ncbi:MAG: hypothetical protein RIS88_2770 [Pseudomonadota bacterium]|jgi:hypothetical protein
MTEAEKWATYTAHKRAFLRANPDATPPSEIEAEMRRIADELGI